MGKDYRRYLIGVNSHALQRAGLLLAAKSNAILSTIMDLTTYLEHKGARQADLAAALGVSPGLVSHWNTGRVKITAERAKQIEQATNGAVRRHELRPDVFDAPAAEERVPV